MLVRILLIVDDADLERRLDRIFEPLETVVAAAPHKAVLWDRVQAFPADLVVMKGSRTFSSKSDGTPVPKSLMLIETFGLEVVTETIIITTVYGQ